jgi:hypothetical protein
VKITLLQVAFLDMLDNAFYSLTVNGKWKYFACFNEAIPTTYSEQISEVLVNIFDVKIEGATELTILKLKSSLSV